MSKEAQEIAKQLQVHSRDLLADVVIELALNGKINMHRVLEEFDRRAYMQGILANLDIPYYPYCEKYLWEPGISLQKKLAELYKQDKTNL